jgi:hypothetical protein
VKARLLVLLLCLSPAVHAGKSAPAENPAVDTMKTSADPGTTVVGEAESSQGLYLTPWKEEHADNLDPPPGLLDVQPQPLNPRAFARQVRDAATLNAWRREQLLPNR